MSSIPANYTVPAVVSAMASVDSAENAARLSRVEALGDIILSDDPKVSIEQKLGAFGSLGRLVEFSWRDAGAREAVGKAYWLRTESPLAKQIQDVGDRYQNMGMAEGRAAQARGGDEEWTGSNPIAAFSRFSEDDQKILMVSLGLDTRYASVKEAYDDFQHQSDEAVARYRAGRQVEAVKVSLSDGARALLGAETAAKIAGSREEQALAALKADAPRTDMASVALTVLQHAAQARADAKIDEKADSKRSVEAPQPPDADRMPQSRKSYRAGDQLDRKA